MKETAERQKRERKEEPEYGSKNKGFDEGRLLPTRPGMRRE